MGPGSDGPLGAMAGMEPHHMNGSLGNKPRKRAHLFFKRTSKAFFSPLNTEMFFIPSGSGDMDGMNKVNLVAAEVVCLSF